MPLSADAVRRAVGTAPHRCSEGATRRWGCRAAGPLRWRVSPDFRPFEVFTNVTFHFGPLMSILIL
jgi:hypothetical protein